jgi:hypothetical protein
LGVSRPLPSRLTRILQTCAVVAGALLYASYVFRFGEGQFRSAGLGDWMDPYFINGLLEHWYRAARTWADPASPPMFFPTRHVLGYSHGLLLYAPYYVPLRAFLHPFQAHTATLLAVIVSGVLCLYLVLRRAGLSFVEAVVLTAFFASSPNVMNGTTGVWSQRASVFLLPPILLLAQWAAAARAPLALGAAFASGLLAALMYVQDFYTAHFALLLAAGFVLAAAVV